MTITLPYRFDTTSVWHTILKGAFAGPHELVWLVGRDGAPDVLLARTDHRSGRIVGAEFGALLGLPVEEKNAPAIIEL